MLRLRGSPPPRPSRNQPGKGEAPVCGGNIGSREHKGHSQRTLEEEIAIGNSQGPQEYLCRVCGKGSILMQGTENRLWDQKSTAQPAM